MTQQQLLFNGQSRIGETIVLWKMKFELEAYRDQFGKAHDGNVVHEEIVTVIAEERTVPGEWGISDYALGVLARSEDGREFTHNWNKGGDGDYWYAATGYDGFKYIDVCRDYLPHRIYATPEGQPAKPVHTLFCELHQRAYLPNSDNSDESETGCPDCSREAKHAKSQSER